MRVQWMWISLAQTHTCWGPWRLKTCVTWPPRLPCPLMVTIPACTGTCTWNQSPWFHSIQLGQQPLEVETCNRVRCSISCYNIHKDKSKKKRERDRKMRTINKRTSFYFKLIFLFLLFVKRHSCSPSKEEEALRFSQQHSQCTDT